jgi:hypothetical protein
LALDKSTVFYLTPYKAGGVVAGSLQVDQGGAFAPLSAALTWRKALDGKAKAFRSGFDSLTTLRGYRHDAGRVPLLQTSGNPPASTTPAELTFSAAGEAPAPAPVSVTIDSANKVLAPGGTKLKFDTKTGLFSGTFTPPAGGKPRAFAGALINGTEALQDSNGNVQVVKVSRGGGQYLGAQGTGSVELTVKEPALP